MYEVKQAIIKDGWVVCPVCGKRQFKVRQGVTVANLEYRCRSSRKKNEHFMLINFIGGI